VGTSPLDKDALNMVVRRGANSCAYCLRIREEMKKKQTVQENEQTQKHKNNTTIYRH
jgi:thioredoxin-related protein